MYVPLRSVLPFILLGKYSMKYSSCLTENITDYPCPLLYIIVHNADSDSYLWSDFALISGIGVDDMFVIVQALDHLPESTKNKPIPERIGVTLRDAGLSITVTSLTDMMAFGIGATTVSHQQIS